MSAAIEIETRQQSECKLWTEVRKHRLTASRFQEMSCSWGIRILKGAPQTAAMKRGLDLEPEILR